MRKIPGSINKLYRGITLNYEMFNNTKMGYSELKPHYQPIIDENERKLTPDGREYGLYVTDDLIIARNKYAHGGGIAVPDEKLFEGFSVNGVESVLTLPKIGVVYQINASSWDFRVPVSVNNSVVEDDTWICNTVPSYKYSILEVIISADFLHEEVIVKGNSEDEIIEKTKKIINVRRKHLETFRNRLFQLKIDNYGNDVRLTIEDVELYKAIYGDGGVAYIDPVLDNLPLNTGSDFIKYLLFKFYHENPKKIDLSKMKYILSLKTALYFEDSVDKLIEKVKDHRIFNAVEKANFVLDKPKDKTNLSISTFTEKEEMYNTVLSILEEGKKYVAKRR